MIRVQKTQNIPLVLSGIGVSQTEDDCLAYAANTVDYDSGKKTFKAKPTIYGHKDVKDQLMTEQHHKCCFCEADFTANGYGDVEHFRPKAGFKATWSEKLNRPGYYWLAYEWHNLFFSCQICNQRHKKNYFPLVDETMRAKNHSSDVSKEVPAIIHPSTDDPDQHLQFNRHIITFKTLKGANSIVGYGLRRKRLNAARKKYLDTVELNNLFWNYDPDRLTDEEKRQICSDMKRSWSDIDKIIRKARAFLLEAASDSQPFALMVRQNFPHLPH